MSLLNISASSTDWKFSTSCELYLQIDFSSVVMFLCHYQAGYYTTELEKLHLLMRITRLDCKWILC